MVFATATPPTHEPRIALVRWRIMQTERDKLHLVGFKRGDGMGRVSSAALQVDLKNQRVLTSSSRVYELVGLPGVMEDIQELWSVWANKNGVAYWRDVTDALFPND